ncbi:hypothetical protein CK203_001993 [Vitis vinifera]|uniref:Uncharacterized protein n=1 Tax=Vitis vinifera TaxID=29760 RepID=A0A438KJA4_VITVI|nr:hypothetical protein CK203_001993 [Vitis vinifera]
MSSTSFVVALALFHLSFFHLNFHQSNFEVQKPYDVSQDQRYSYVDGVHKLWVYSVGTPPLGKHVARSSW